MREKLWWLNEESQQILNRGYLLKGETVEGAIDRITTAASKRLYKPELKERFKELIERGWMSLSSPIWANLGTARGLPISCFNVHVPDSIEGITNKSSEVIMQTKLGGGTSGYFGELRGRGAAITDNGKSSGAVSFMRLFDTIMDVVSQGACYEEGTEVLTNSGFKDFRDVVYGSDLIAQVDEFNNISFTSNYELTTKVFDGDMVKIKGKKRESLVDISVTPNHRMVIEKLKKNKSGKYWAGNTEIVLAKDLKLHRDNRIFISGETENKGRGLSDEERFMIAFQADGRKDFNSKLVRFRFKKERKVIKLKNICLSLKLSYDLKVDVNGVYDIVIHNANQLKKNTLEWVDYSNVSKQWCEEFLDEVSFWDGSKNKDRTSFSYSSIYEVNTDVIQTVSVLCNKRSRKSVYSNREGNRKPLYSITISNNNKVLGDSCEVYNEYYNGTVYCAIVPKGRLVVRRNGRTLVCGNTRRGAFAAYLDIDHPDVEEFLSIKDIGSPIQNLFTGVCVPDYWMQEMIEGDESKRKIWARVLESRQQKGLPYIFFTDNVNKNKPQVYKDKGMVINASNLCSEIALPSNDNESFVCCLLSMNLELYDEWKNTDAVKMATYFLDAVMSEFIEKTEGNYFMQSAHNFAKRHRSIGIGVMGYHSYLQSKNIPFGDLRAYGFNTKVFKEIYEASQEASRELAEIFGEPEILQGYGLRHTTTIAIAPTTSSSAILGQVSPGIEPFSSNYYKAGLAKGNFIRKNKYLEALLEEKGLNTEDTWRQIMLDHGSVMKVEGLTDEEKEVFKTFKEISQADIINQAAHRQVYIDQSQSLNLNIPPDLPIREVNKLYIDAWKQGVKTLYYQRSQSVSKELLSNIVTCTPCEA